jgi:hypothetical protein
MAASSGVVPTIAFSQVNDPANAGQPLGGPMSQGMNAVKLPEREKGGVSVVSSRLSLARKAPGLEL